MSGPRKSYGEKLMDPRWQKKRLRILERDEFTCQRCMDSESTLHVHHHRYRGEPWEVDDSWLVTLCADCHEIETESRKEQGKELLEMLGVAGGFASDLDQVFTDPIREYAAKVHAGSASKFQPPDTEVIGHLLAMALESKAAGSQFWTDVERHYFDWLRAKDERRNAKKEEAVRDA